MIYIQLFAWDDGTNLPPFWDEDSFLLMFELFVYLIAVDFGDFDQGYRQRELLYMETLNIIRKSLLDKYAIEDPARIAPNVLLAQSFYMIGVQVRESTKLSKYTSIWSRSLESHKLT